MHGPRLRPSKGLAATGIGGRMPSRLALAAALAVPALLAGCFQSTGGAGNGMDNGLAQARNDARAAAQAADQAHFPTSAPPVLNASSPNPPAAPQPLGALPVLFVGQAWAGTASSQATATAQLTWQVAAVGERLDLGGHAYDTDRLRLASNHLTGTAWLRGSDLALVKLAWDAAPDPSQPYPAGTVTTYDPPCAIQWPIHAGNTWNSTCTQRSWSTATPDRVAQAAQRVSWSVASTPSGGLRLQGDGTLTYPDRPDSTARFTQAIVVGTAACEPLAWSRTDSEGASEQLATTCHAA